MKNLTKTLLALMVVLALSPFITWAQEGSVPNEEIPPSDQPIEEQLPPPQEETLPATSEEPAGGVVTDPAPVPEALPTTTTEEPKPSPSTAITADQAPTTSSTMPETQTINLGTATTDVALESEENNFNTMLAIIAGALVLVGAGTIWKFKSKKIKTNTNKEKDENEDGKKCLNFKKLMEEKLNELKDLEGALTEMAQNKAEAKVKTMIQGTAAEKVVEEIEKIKKEYEKLKILYEECIMSMNTPMQTNWHLRVRAVIYENGKFLVVRAKNSSHIYLPGGHVEAGEGLEVALKRELLEETGRNSNIKEYLGAIENSWVQGKTKEWEITHFFRGAIQDFEAQPQQVVSVEEDLEFLWVGPSEFEKLNLLPLPLRPLLDNVVKNENKIWWASSME